MGIFVARCSLCLIRLARASAGCSINFVLLLLLFVAALSDDSEDLVVEVEEPPSVEVFVPTAEWQEVGRDTSIPAGLHVRINLETGLREAKLWEGSKFNGDQRRTHHHGHSDRRGIINKRSKVFTREEYLEMLREGDRTDRPHPLALTQVTGDGDVHYPPTLTHSHAVSENILPLTVHREVADMLQLIRVLLDSTTPLSQMLSVLEELEYHVHQIDNGCDLVAMGGLSVLLRLLNHTSEDVRGGAALVVGGAAQSNLVVQEEVVVLGGVKSLCGLLSQSELLQRRGLFALGAVVRGNPSVHSLDDCPELVRLHQRFHESSERVQLKAITLVTDLAAVLVDSCVWCEEALSLLHSNSPLLVGAGLSAVAALNCDHKEQLTLLEELMERFADHNELVDSCKGLLDKARRQKTEL